tara:strand:- start:61 stop:1326 length:1266 start_codon:yes stop_codon:yes gene_type:complete
MRKVVKISVSDLDNIVKNVIEEQLKMTKRTTRAKDTERTRSTEDEKYGKVVEKIAEKKEKWSNRTSVISPEPTELQWALYGAGIYIVDNDSRKKNSEGRTEYKLVPGDVGKGRLKSFKELYSVMSEESKSVMDSSKEINPAFYAYVIKSSDSLVGVFNRTKRDSRSVTVDNSESQKLGTSPNEVEVPKLIFSDSDIPLKNKFATGSPNLKNEYVTQFDSTFTDILESYKNDMVKNNTDSRITFPGKYLIKDITIVSSSSKVPHTRLPEPYTTDPKDPNDTEGFLRLSEDRAESMMKMVKNYISSNSDNFIMDKNFTESVNARGENGDGTSGPDWDKNKGSQHQDYLDAQQAKVIITFAVIPSFIKDDDIPTPDISSNGFILTVSATKRGKTEISLNFRPKSRRYKGGKVKNAGSTLCPIFS